MTSKSHKQVRAGVEHVFARMKTWKILRDCRLKGDGVQRLAVHREGRLELHDALVSLACGLNCRRRLTEAIRDLVASS